MQLSTGTRVGAYEIVGLLGAGGMGEVYRARDGRLNRDVALKVLPEAFALDPDRLARFKREAQVLAALNHPNIAAIYGFEDGPAQAGHDGGPIHALVLELVEGPTLADRIALGPISPDEALPIARQITDGRRVAYHLEPSEGSPGIFVRAADGTGDIERLTTGTHLPQFWSPDGTRLVYVDFGTDPINGTGPADIGMVTVTGERRAQKLLSTPAREATPRMAPDGRWLAYETNETGETEIFVRPFPDVTAGRWRISSAGGSKPVWAKDGRTIFYRSGQTIMAVAVRGTTPADWGSPEKLFEGAYIFEDGPPTFDVAPDGRFLMIKEGGDEATTQAPDTLIVVQNWFEELRRRVPN